MPRPSACATVADQIADADALAPAFSRRRGSAVAVRDVLDGDNPVLPQVERQLLVQPIDERRAVLVQERHEADRPFLRVAAGEGQRPRVR